MVRDKMVRDKTGRPEEPRSIARIGSYEIVRKLARGGMAELFLARTVGPEGFAKLVVLKKILPNYAENPKFVRLFLDEAKLVGTFDHPHIAHVYDMGKADGEYYFTMEYVHGQDVRTTTRRAARDGTPILVEHAVQIARNIAAALQYAHERKRDDGTLLDIVHRDVSPSNILISYEGAVKLVDFGVAKAASSSVKTRTGALKGKISYMSPEQAKGAAIDRRSDIFSLGIVLWELVSGRRLYKAENDLATLQMIINSKPQPLSQLRTDCPTALDEIVLRALATNVSERYQTADQMLTDLDALAREHRYDQSANALRRFMHELYDEEIKAWEGAHAAGQTLIDHVLAAQPTMILPISGSDLSDADVEEDADEEESSHADSQQLTHTPTTLTSLPPSGSHEVLTDEATEIQTQPHQVVKPTIQLSVPPPPTRPRSEPGAPAHRDPGIPAGRMPAEPAAFPMAPAEWRREGKPTPHVDGSRDAITRGVLIACSVLFALIVLLALAFRDNPAPPPASAAPTGSDTSGGDKVEMKVVPVVP